MPKFTGPLIVGRLDSDVTAAWIDVSGTANFSGGIRGEGGAKYELIQQVTVHQNNTAGNPVVASLRSGANITDISVDVEIAFETTAAHPCDIEFDAGGTRFAYAVVSATGRYYPLSPLAGGVSVSMRPRSLRNLSVAQVTAHVSQKGAATAMTAGQAFVTIRYVV